MPKVQLFGARKTQVVLEDDNGDVVVIRTDLTPGQAKAMAARLNGVVTTAEKEFKPTRREQKFSIHFEGDWEFLSHEDADEFYTVNEIASQLKDSINDMDPWDGQYEFPTKVKVTVTKVYDKQVPNE